MKMMLQHELTLSLYIIAFAMLISAVYRFWWQEKPVTIRRLPYLDQIETAVNSSAERGKPIINLPCGWMSAIVPALGRGFYDVYKHVSTMAGELNVRMYGATADAAFHTVYENYCRQGFIASGHPERYREEDQLTIIGGSYAWSTGAIGLVQRTQPGVALFLGMWGWNAQVNVLKACQLLPEKCVMVGAGTYPDNVTYLVAMCDYTMLSDECLAVASVLKKESYFDAKLVGLDLMKLLMVGLLVGSFILAALGIDIVQYL